jgi:hypothetical protein
MILKLIHLDKRRSRPIVQIIEGRSDRIRVRISDHLLSRRTIQDGTRRHPSSIDCASILRIVAGGLTKCAEILTPRCTLAHFLVSKDISIRRSWHKVTRLQGICTTSPLSGHFLLD